MVAWRRARSSGPSSAEAGPASSGLMRAVPPGWSLTTDRPSDVARAPYSPLGSAMAAQRPNTPTLRCSRHFTAADFPVPGSPAMSMLGLVTSPAA